MSTVHRRSVVVVLIAALALLVVAAPARAQYADPSDFAFPVTRRAVDTYARMLSMSPEQKDGAMALYEGYRAGLKAVQADMSKAMKEMQEKVSDTGDWTVWQKEGATIFKGFEDRMESLEDGFFSDVKQMLTEEQLSRFIKVERHRRRDKEMKMAMVSGARVDLVNVLNDLKIDPESSPELASAIESYEADLDRMLVARKAAMKRMEEKQQEMQEQAMSGNFAALGDMFKEWQEVERPMRDLNKSYARRIEPLLTDEQRAGFDREFKRRAFPRVYREPAVVKAMAAAEKFEDLSGEQKTQVAELKAQYERDAAPLNVRWSQAIEQRDDKGFNPMAAMFNPEAQKDNPVLEPRKARRDLDKETMSKLEGILSDEQRERLPKEERNPQQEAMEMMDFDIDFEAIENADEEE